MPFEFVTKAKTIKVQYHTPPDEALESPALMPPWARLAMEAASRRAQTPASPNPRPSPTASKAWFGPALPAFER